VGMKDAKACMEIRKGLDARGYSIPLCADMHFAPKVALAVADAVEKVRINPGNFVDGRKTFEGKVYETDEDYFKVGARRSLSRPLLFSLSLSLSLRSCSFFSRSLSLSSPSRCRLIRAVRT